MFPSILIVDDEPTILQSLGGILTDEGFEVITASNGYEALKLIDSESPDLVLLDIWMPGIDGIETLKVIRNEHPHLQVIIITGHGTIETAVKATKIGAFDLIEKPLSIEKVIVSINNALNFRRLEEENRYLRKKTIEKNSITGNSPPITVLKKQIAIAAPTDSWILITGENGTGKELVARTIHQLSPRAEQPIIDVNCAAIPDDLIESELFGHEKGVLAGSNQKKRGKFELASNGTIFLDQVGDMSLKTQAKILRVLEEGRFQRVGGSRTLNVKVRVIAASNKDLEQEIAHANFREDLYYRLNVIPIDVPPLRNRREDIPLLIETFLDESEKRNRIKRKQISPEAIQALQEYHWPGNVRELKNLVERLTIMVGRDMIEASDIPELCNSKATAANQSSGATALFSINSLEAAKDAFEREFLQHKFEEHGHNVNRMAKTLGVDAVDLSKKLKKQGSA